MTSLLSALVIGVALSLAWNGLAFSLVTLSFELAIGPAGTDANGPWGIHVGQHPEVTPQHVKAGLEEAARRIAGSSRSGAWM